MLGCWQAENIYQPPGELTAFYPPKLNGIIPPKKRNRTIPASFCPHKQLENGQVAIGSGSKAGVEPGRAIRNL